MILHELKAVKHLHTAGRTTAGTNLHNMRDMHQRYLRPIG
jgi:hypothetical protein